MKDEKLNGLITPDGEYVRLDDLKAMERALRRLNTGDTKEVLRGLRCVAVELAKEYEDAAARRFLLRAREIVRRRLAKLRRRESKWCVSALPSSASSVTTLPGSVTSTVSWWASATT